jgi:hypothetical protein
MFSFTKGKDIAYFTEGKLKGKILKIYGENIFDKVLKPDIKIKRNEYSELLDEEFYKDNGIKRDSIINFNNKLDHNEKGDNEYENELLELAEKHVEKELRTSLFFNDKNKLFPMPQMLSERIYVPAPSMAGKSTFISQYLDEMRKQKGGKNRDIYIFSRLKEDKAFDKFKKVVRIPLEKGFFNKHPLEIENFKKAILIFDDIDTLADKDVVKYLRYFRDDVLETGRHYGITALSTSHIITNFMATRALINEANAIVLFPRGSSFAGVASFLERYMGFTKKQIDLVKDLPSRWIYIWKSYPKYAIHEKGAFLF